MQWPNLFSSYGSGSGNGRASQGTAIAAKLRAGLFAIALVWGLVLPAYAQELVAASPDVTIERSVVAADEDVVVDNQLGIVVLENLGVLPDASEIVAFGLTAAGDRLIAFETTTALPGGVVARPGDVVRYDGGGYVVELDSVVAGLPDGVGVDAVSLSPQGLLLSFDTTVDLGGGVYAADEDLVDWDGARFALALDSSSVGVDRALDADAAQDLGAGRFLVSFDTAGQIAGVAFADEDILRFDGGNWTLEYDADAADPNWGPADLDAFMVPEPSTLIGLASGVLLLTGLGLKRRRGD